MRHRRCDATGEPNVIVLDEDGIEEPDPVIRRPASSDGVFLQHAKRGRRLARVEDRNAAAGGVHESAGLCGDAG